MAQQPVKNQAQNSQTNPVTIRYLAMNEMYIIDQISELDGRNPGLNDGEFLFHASSKGFIAAIFNSEVIGTISIINYKDNLSFIGLHYVVPHLREHGISEKLLSVALNHAGERDIGLNCKEEDAALYEKAGFNTAYKIITYEGKCGDEFNVPETIKSPFSYSFDALYSYYKKIFPYERKRFVSFWLNQPKSLLLGKYQEDKCKGCGLFKPCKKGYRLAPLVSDDMQSAQEILVTLSSHFTPGTPYYLDIPETNIDAINLANELGLKKINETLRMYKGNEHEISLKNCYSFTSLEIG